MNKSAVGRACRRIAVISLCFPLVSVFFVGTASAAQDGIYAIFVAHPDDEADALAGTDSLSSKHKVIVVLTRGEADAACTIGGFPQSYQGPSHPTDPNSYDRGEIPPPYPITDRYTVECENNRINSFLHFMGAIGSKDPSMPTGYSARSLSGSAAAPPEHTRSTGPPTRYDDATARPGNRVRVWNDASGQNRATLVQFDLGDSDLTKEEVQWAVDRLIQRRAYYGIPNLPWHRAFTNFDNTPRYPSCDVYRHPDHRRVHEAFFDTSYPYAYGHFATHRGRTCDTDVDPTASYSYSLDWRNYFFELGSGSDPQRIGPFQRRYGWLIPSWLRREAWDSATSPDPKYGNVQHFWSRNP